MKIPNASAGFNTKPVLRKPFIGATTTETIEKIRHAQPEPIARFNYEVPAELERIVRKCLEKDRENRYQSARELMIDLKNLRRDLESDSKITTRIPILVFINVDPIFTNLRLTPDIQKSFSASGCLKIITPKAFAKSSLGLERSDNPG